MDHGREFLFSVGDPELIEDECEKSYAELKKGLFEKGHSYTIHETLLTQLSPVLRTYVGCATTLYGELGQILAWTERQALGKASKTNTPGGTSSGVLVSVVAGAGFEPAAFRL